MIDRTPLEPPPIVIGVVGPPKVGKSTLVQCLIKNFTRKTLTNIQGPVTIVSGECRPLAPPLRVKKKKCYVLIWHDWL